MDKKFLSPLVPVSLDDKLGTTTLKPAPESHLTLRDSDQCRSCPGRECISACPAGTYSWEMTSRRLVISHDNCLECGTCRVSCPFMNIEWTCPPGGFGVRYRYG